MTRHELREQTFLLLFRADFYEPDERVAQEALFHEERDEIKESDRIAIDRKYEAILERLPEIDRLINERTEGWKTSRMGKVELTILRLAVYEMLEDEDVPVGVAINEAVELAKAYGPDNAPSFVNGVLGRVAEKL